MKRIRNEVLKNPAQKAKVFGLVFLLLLLLVSAPASGSEGVQYELVANTTSDPEGYYFFEDLPDGEYALLSACYSYSSMYKTWQWYTGDGDAVVNGSDLSDVNITISSESLVEPADVLGYLNRSSLSGYTVTTKGTPKANATVVLTDGSGKLMANTTSDSEGHYFFEDLPNGEYALLSACYSYSSMYKTWQWYTGDGDAFVDGSDLSDVNITISSESLVEPADVLSYLNRSSLSGYTVTTKGTPKANATVVLTDGSGKLMANTTSNSEGHYFFEDLPNGEYALLSACYSYSSMYKTWQWYTGDGDAVLNGSDLSDVNITISSESLVEPADVLGYLNRSSLSGYTVTTKGTSKGNATVVLLKEKYTDLSNSPHLNVSIITGYRYDFQLETAVNRLNSNSDLNLTVSYFTPNNLESHNEIDFGSMDIIYINMFTQSADVLQDDIAEAIANGAVVIGQTTTLPDNIPYVPSGLEDEAALKAYLQGYWANLAADDRNLDYMVFYLANEYYGREDLNAEAPIGPPARAIYHPDFVNGSQLYFAESYEEYLAWYANREDGGHRYNASAPTIGMAFYVSYYPNRIEPFDTLIREFESRGVNVLTFYGDSSNPCDPFIRNETETYVDALISFTYRGNYFDTEGLDIPLINGVLNGYLNYTEWNESSSPLPADSMMRIYRPEWYGFIDPIMISTIDLDPETEEEIYVSVPGQVEWLVNRTLAQVELSPERTPEAEKKVAIIYYNHGCGKDGIGASYLDVAPSICNLLEGMADAGYAVDSASIPNGSELTDLMLVQGTNIGTWAPGELDRLVDEGDVALIPNSTYSEWFEALPEERQREVISQWGEAPGQIMVYENESGKFLVIPKIEVGDGVILAPQPTRGWLQDNDALYHSKDLPPHHQYIAFYLWLQNEYGADAMVNMGRHGTVEWLPGKQFFLSCEDWPALMNGDIPVIYPYVMDGLGEGIQAKRRGNAVVIDHLIPPVLEAGLYGKYAELDKAVLEYTNSVDMGMEEEIVEMHKAEILNLTEELGLDEQLNMSLAEDDQVFEDIFLDELGDILEELKSTAMPYGLHVLGTSPEGDELVGMVNSMLGQPFEAHVEFCFDPALSGYNNSDEAEFALLECVLLQGSSPAGAQAFVLNCGENSTLTADLETAGAYAALLAGGKDEINQVLKALDGRFIEPNAGGDPVRDPDTLPSGRNFYSFDPEEIPSEEAWILGTEMADEMLGQYRESHNGSYPQKVAYVLWAGETTRNEGVMEAQILYLLGVKPDFEDEDEDFDSYDDLVFIPDEELGRPRIDVMVQISGLYRDTYPNNIRLIDYAVRTVCDGSEFPGTEEYPNYVLENTKTLASELNKTLQNETLSWQVATLRIFGPADGAYGTGMSNVVSASNTWNDTDELAELYISKMSNAYGEYIWGESLADFTGCEELENEAFFTDNLRDVEVTLHSRSSNTYGVLDTDEFFQYLGGLNLAVKYASGGEYPESFIFNLREPGSEMVETLGSFLEKELYARYFNPTWIEGMQQNGYAGAAEMADFLENLWGWEAVNPDLISDDVWNRVYQTYVGDQELSDWLKDSNPYAYQAITARMLETALKGNWDASDEVLKSLAAEYAESVVNDGVTCCHHTCGNPTLNSYVAGLVSVPGFSDAIEAATKQQLEQDKPEKHSSSGNKGSSTPVVRSAEGSNQTLVQSDAGYGVDSPEPAPAVPKSADSNYVEGYEMTKESVENEDEGGISFSGADIVGTLFVLVAAGGIYLGMRKKKM
ncbi:cobaltochelatase subunit CobN [Methanosarcina sp. KYL-1]|uniref:cobaltochelatase subunit CobN n=1 Tax=Methanosarcina sp. KYL-1 TaxID=2602068 RepID=UPI002100ED56|nr:cobaltochelatase subunit CobN [Methanosarcina sp. KYL-1]MCQ1536264.1 cobaltochelatase subunit CobN [Methanosarcina sp. KYL-1]